MPIAAGSKGYSSNDSVKWRAFLAQQNPSLSELVAFELTLSKLQALTELLFSLEVLLFGPLTMHSLGSMTERTLV